MKRVLIFLTIGLMLPSVYVRAQSVPALMNFQGQVLAADGTPLPTGDYDLTFQIFDAAEGGAVIWGPQILDGAGGVGHGLRIPVVQGYFNVMLGPLDVSSRPLSGAFQGATRFLEIKVGTNNPISPRQQILSAPYAFIAANAANVLAGGVSTLALADGAVSTLKLNDSAVTVSKVADASISVSKLAQDVLNRLLPPGTIVAFGGTVAPSGWVLCDGSVRNGSDPAFSALFTAIGNTYGGSAPNFNLPDLRGRTVIGVGQGPELSNRTLATKLGNEMETITQVPAHTHALSGGILNGGVHSHTINGWIASGSTRKVDTALGSSSNFAVDTTIDGAHSHTHNLVVQSAGLAGGVPVNNMQPFIVLTYIIKL